MRNLDQYRFVEKLQFNASDHCDIKTIEGMLFDECETFLCEDSFAAKIMKNGIYKIPILMSQEQ